MRGGHEVHALRTARAVGFGLQSAVFGGSGASASGGIGLEAALEVVVVVGGSGEWTEEAGVGLGVDRAVQISIFEGQDCVFTQFTELEESRHGGLMNSREEKKNKKMGGD